MWRGVAGAGDVAAALAQGSAARVTGATAMNVASSRSHALLAVRLAPAQPEGAATTLHLVDLAGVILLGPVQCLGSRVCPLMQYRNVCQLALSPFMQKA